MADSPLEELSIAMVGDQQMSELHERFMSIAGPTDVLTFPLENDARGRTTSGELVLCVPEARRRAREHRVLLAHELLLYAIHGMLHLSGYDDRTDRGYKTMHSTEDDLLCRLGIGPVFRPASAGANRPSSFKGSAKSRKPRRTH
jgi:probable rRNA maturation factor